MRSIKQIVLAWLTACLPACLPAATYYISLEGDDANDGKSAATSLATLSAAVALAEAGDTVYVLPGHYMADGETFMKEENAGSDGQYKIVWHFSKSGQPSKPICFIGLSGDDGSRPVFDLSEVKPEGWRVTAFLVSGSYLLFRNFEVVGIQVNRTDHTQAENFRVTGGSRNTFEYIACHDGMGIGFYLTRESAYNLFVNCDGYNNYDPVSDIQEKTEMGSGGNNDGFGCHVAEDSPGNVFIGCRAWNNADDGFDLINCYSPVTICYSIAWRNGYDADNTSRGDGNGFKAGGYGMTGGKYLPAGGAPMHEVYSSIAASNKSNGVYSNHHLGGVWFHDNTAYRNGRFNYCLVNRRGAAEEDAVDVNGYGHRIERNLSLVSDGKDNHVSDLRGDEGGNTVEGNSFYWVDKNSGGWAYTAYGNSVFESTRVADFTLSRQPDGMLSDANQSVLRQKVWLGLGCSFDGYAKAIEDYRKVTGAESDGGTTAISSVKGDDGSLDPGSQGPAPVVTGPVTDLQGRRVSRPGKGLYIYKGRKVIIK